MQAFLDEKTRAKISLVYTEKELQDVLLPLIQPAHLYKSLGGCVLELLGSPGHWSILQYSSGSRCAKCHVH